jgi:hypothetical protein
MHQVSDFNTPEGTLGAGYFMSFTDPQGKRER